MDKATGHLQARYPFKKDPGVLIDNGKDAKACQITQERWQIKNKTHSQYTEQFLDMVNRGVIFKISQTEVLNDLTIKVPNTLANIF